MAISKRKILVVDDEKDICEIICLILREKPEYSDLDIQYCVSSCQALELIKANTVDILITDITMPIVDGFDLLEVVLREHRHTQVIVCTGNYYRTTAITLFNDGIFFLLKKPLIQEQIYQAIDICLAKIDFWETVSFAGAKV